ncbi:hypothetical protein NA57DRAFT_80578 [Rhizodiscina lignyota]|uniref:Uncharacterized protein n=1 Tax=Rhizodiscina lignyota TaxID=1504668 RepID=A0A9P4I336_9PEZI|nr:hypothetical protein NA57DRAFT_80578 [Rhizodiscina lignyota]
MANNPRNLLLGAAGVGACLYLFTNNIFSTPGTKQIEDRFSAGGGSDTHTPAQATPRGRPEMTQGAAGSRGVDSKYFKENYASQLDDSGPVAKKLHESNYGQGKGK